MIDLFRFEPMSRLLADMDWKTLIDSAPEYGFLGGLVGTVGMMIGAAVAILYGWTRTFRDWKPSQDSVYAGLDKIITALVAVAIVALWLFADRQNAVAYIQFALSLVAVAVVASIAYIGLRVGITCPFKEVGCENLPTGEMLVWGGFWLTREAKQRPAGVTVCDFLAGNGYNKTAVWPRGSLAAAAMTTALVLLLIVAAGAIGLSAAATTAQVALTKKPVTQIGRSWNDIPGIPSTPAPSP